MSKQGFVWLVVSLVLTFGGSSAFGQTAVTASLSPEVVVYDKAGEITVDLLIAGVTGVAGLDITLHYPAERFDGPPTFVEGDLNGLIEVNNTVAGELIIVFARATGLTADSGTLISLTFPVPCLGNIGFPDGNPVDFTMEEFLAFDEGSNLLDSDDSTLSVGLRCLGVSVPSMSFSTLKAQFRP